jgi:predicted AlkP superfamily pyrophosphatase or phosphodiesterase
VTSANAIENKIRAESKAKFASLGLPNEFVAPNYSGRSILNIPASIVKILGGNMHTPGLDADILGRFPNGVRRIVFLISDAMGYRRTLDALDGNKQNGFHALMKQGATIAPITSVFPSTTTAALTALWSGYSPAEHGFLGFLLFLREVSARCEMISFSPLATRDLKPQQLVDAGIEPEKFLPVPSLPQTLAKFGVPTYHFIEQPYVKSALSRAQIRGQKETFGFVSSSDMWVTMRNVVEQHKDERAAFISYWSAADSIQHSYGASSETLIAEIDNLAYSFEREFLGRLSPAAREGTLFILTADHGQIDLPAKNAVRFSEYPEIQSRLLFGYTGDARAAYLYCRQGEKDFVRDYIERNLADKFFVLDSQSALKAGLFGSGTLAPETEYRIGDLLLLARGNNFLWDRKDDYKMAASHGGLAAEEMLVPILLARLDS